MSKKLLFVVNVDWFFLSHRLPIALGAIQDGYEVHIATGITDRLLEMQEYGFIVHPLPIHRSDSRLPGAIRLFREIFRVYRAVRPEIIHLVTIKPVLLGGLVARLAKVPSVVAAISGLGFLFINETPRSKFVRSVVSQIYRLALGHPNLRVIVQNHDDLITVQQMANLPDQSFCILPGSGVSLKDYSAHPESLDVPIVLMASRMLIDKGVVEFVTAARRLKSNKIEARFVLVGDPDSVNPASLTQAQLESWQQEGIIEWWGHQKWMPKVFEQAHIVVLPSYREGFPKVLIEASACGRAIITTDVPGCRDAIEHGITGLLVPPRDVDTLAEAMKTLILNQNLRRQMGSAGRKRAERLFPVEKIVDSHLQIYQELTNKTRASAPELRKEKSL